MNKPTATNKEIGKRIHNLRKEHGIKSEVFSNILGISVGFLGLIERGNRGTTIPW